MMEIVIHNFKHATMITVFVFVMMMFIDYLTVLTKGKINGIIKGGLIRQYILTSFLGATPGCLGAFLNVSFYIHGLISFGAIVGGMIATSGDEAFIMLALFPGKAVLLFVILFFFGIIFAYIVDKIAPLLRIKPCRECEFTSYHAQDECRCLDFKEMIEHFRSISFARFMLLVLLIGALLGIISGIVGPECWEWKRITFVSLVSLAFFIVITVPDHYLDEHIWNHIAKQHLWRVFLWSFCVLLLVDVGLQFFNLAQFVEAHMFWVLLLSGLVAMIPESGPHLLFVMMFAKGLVPFSVLLTSSIIQDGHGMLPLLSYTIRDTLLIKIFNFAIGLSIGLILYSLGF